MMTHSDRVYSGPTQHFDKHVYMCEKGSRTHIQFCYVEEAKLGVWLS